MRIIGSILIFNGIFQAFGKHFTKLKSKWLLP